MTRLDRWLDRLLRFLGGRSERNTLVLAIALYAGIGLILPLGLRVSTPWLISLNVIGTSLAGTVMLAWLATQVRAQQRRHLVEWTTDLRLLNSSEFEWLVGELFRREGWTVEETGRAGGPDGNVDLRLARGNQKRLVQCKRWTSWQVTVDDIRGFGGTLLREGMRGTDGIFVTLSEFTPQAQEEGIKAGIALISKAELYGRVEAVKRQEPCPTCSAPMILDRSARGWWLRCIARGCEGKRDLGADPGRAVDLLMERD